MPPAPFYEGPEQMQKEGETCLVQIGRFLRERGRKSLRHNGAADCLDNVS